MGIGLPTGCHRDGDPPARCGRSPADGPWSSQSSRIVCCRARAWPTCTKSCSCRLMRAAARRSLRSVPAAAGGEDRGKRARVAFQAPAGCTSPRVRAIPSFCPSADTQLGHASNPTVKPRRVRRLAGGSWGAHGLHAYAGSVLPVFLANFTSPGRVPRPGVLSAPCPPGGAGSAGGVDPISLATWAFTSSPTAERSLLMVVAGLV